MNILKSFKQLFDLLAVSIHSFINSFSFCIPWKKGGCVDRILSFFVPIALEDKQAICM